MLDEVHADIFPWSTGGKVTGFEWHGPHGCPSSGNMVNALRSESIEYQEHFGKPSHKAMQGQTSESRSEKRECSKHSVVMCKDPGYRRREYFLANSSRTPAKIPYSQGRALDADFQLQSNQLISLNMRRSSPTFPV